MFLIAFAACGDSEPRSPTAPPEEDAGSSGPTDLCPNPDDPRVHYRDRDPSACARVTLECTTEQNGFHNKCGCGCIDKGDPLCPPVDDPSIEWVSHDPAQCQGIPLCRPDQHPFNSSCGCGCATPGG